MPGMSRLSPRSARHVISRWFQSLCKKRCAEENPRTNSFFSGAWACPRLSLRRRLTRELCSSAVSPGRARRRRIGGSPWIDMSSMDICGERPDNKEKRSPSGTTERKERSRNGTTYSIPFWGNLVTKQSRIVTRVKPRNAFWNHLYNEHRDKAIAPREPNFPKTDLV